MFSSGFYIFFIAVLRVSKILVNSQWPSLMSQKLQENKHVTLWMEKETKHINFWMKTLNPPERNRQSLYFYKSKNWIALEATICLNSKRNPRVARATPRNLNSH